MEVENRRSHGCNCTINLNVESVTQKLIVLAYSKILLVLNFIYKKIACMILSVMWGPKSQSTSSKSYVCLFMACLCSNLDKLKITFSHQRFSLYNNLF